VCSDDWQGLYENNKLVLEDHRIRIEDAFNKVISSGGISQFSRRECDYKWMDVRVCLPESLSDVKFIDD
jgi:hypothetical protein